MSHSQRLNGVAISIAFCLLIQLFMTPNLWQAERAFPLFSLLEAPAWLHQYLYYTCIAGLLLILFLSPYKKAYGLYFLALLPLLLLDLNRLQVWLYQFSLFLGIIALGRKKLESYRLQALQLALAATYFWSGLHKLNTYFINDIFPDLLTPLGFEAGPALGLAAALLEMSLGPGLLWKRSRPYFLALAVLMHLFLLGLLGPLGQNWNAVIWPWNIALIAIAWLLFYQSPYAIHYQLWTKLRQFPIFVVVILLFVLLPGLNRFGYWDEQLSFKMYAGMQPEGVFYLNREDQVCFPEVLGNDWDKNQNPNRPGEHFVIIDQWAFAELETPPYTSATSLRQIRQKLCACLRYPAGGRLEVIHGHPWDRSKESTTVYHCTEQKEKSK
ncbi:MAG: hypothetical protein AAGG75_25000 [Bacteroidota bacterium]